MALRLGSVVALALMAATIKLAEAGGVKLGEVLFFRQTFSLVPVLAFVAAGQGLGSLRTRRLGAHLMRTVVGLTSMCCVFSTILLLPLAEATTLQFTVPIFATVLGALVLHEPTGWHRWGAVALGFAGVVIVAGPGSGHMPALGLVTGLSGALLTATVSILLRQIGKTEAPATTVFYFSLMSVPPLAIVFVFQVSAHDGLTWMWLVATGLAGGTAQILLTASLKHAPVSVVTPMDYTGLIWATMLGWALFGTLPGWTTWAGAPIIIASGLYIVWREYRLRKRPVATEAVADYGAGAAGSQSRR